MGIGGLDEKLKVIFRRAFASRLFPAEVVEKLGISAIGFLFAVFVEIFKICFGLDTGGQHVKGILLYGPPGTGKTLIARQIGKMLNGRDHKIVNGPEILNKYVGASEKKIRALFEDAEEEEQRVRYKIIFSIRLFWIKLLLCFQYLRFQLGPKSGLHVIIFDEIDAICKSRISSGASGSKAVGDSIVNQILSKLDGVEKLNNILVIGMTNRKDLIDEALLRPGRIEVTFLFQLCLCLSLILIYAAI